MIDIQKVRDNLDTYKQVCKNKKIDLDVDNILSLDEQRKTLQTELDDLKYHQKTAGKLGDYELAKKLKKNISDKEIDYKSTKDTLDALRLKMPQFVRDDVPLGESEDNNVVVDIYGQIPEFDFEPKSHMELMQAHDMIDVERGVKISGARSYFLKNQGVLLENALFQYALDKMVNKFGFTLMSVPHIVKEDAFIGAGFFPGGEDDVYYLEKDDKRLIATAENSLISYHMDEILVKEDLPLKYVALSPSYRREAGTYGKDTQGLYRVHQFNKIEQIIICTADIQVSNKWYDNIMSYAKEVLDDLKIPYQILQICTGDLGSGKYVQHDIECWMPSRDSYGETHSVSSLLDYQARRLNLRYRDKDGTIKYCYTLNNTVLASPRILIPLIENNQTKDGEIQIPEVLKKYML